MSRLQPYLLLSYLLGCLCGITSASPTPHDLRQLVKPAIGSGYSIIDVLQSDLDHNGDPEVIAITSKQIENGHPLGGEIVILHYNKSRLHVVWRQARLNPWKLQLGDVDGYGRTEIICGVWKKSPKDPVMEKRTFVYSWNGRRMMPMWLGSRLSRRFDDFAVADVNGDRMAEIVSLERAPGGKHRISIYRWFSFGFESLASSDEIIGLATVNKRHDCVVVTSNRGDLRVQLAGKSIRLNKI